ncbi:SAM dependent carboxyl methyltransferase - like 10 [Theobroma cacao]|nr:SAM dependent carboxyl methyltransferase - like 10 [Theobroma cacao]
MKVEQVLHMNGGVGKDSYANNSSLQRTVISMVKPKLGESIVELYCAMLPECLKIADLGCSAGPNTLSVVAEIIDIIDETCQRLKYAPPSLQAFLNDLPGNDFNIIFKSLPSFYERLDREKGNEYLGKCFIAGAPGSFYGRLFPDNCLHFVHSSYAIMWLSKAPKELGTEMRAAASNKGNICVAKTSLPDVYEAYLEQFKRDFALFLRCRADEIVPGGRMLLTTMGSIRSDDPLTMWEFVGLKLNEMVSEGLIEEEKLESFDLPYYAATTEEVKEVIEAEGSFTLQRLEVFNMDWDAYIKQADSNLDKTARAAIIAKDIRAVGEPILASHFGEDIMDDLFHRFKEDVLEYMEAHKCQYINIVMSLTKKEN